MKWKRKFLFELCCFQFTVIFLLFSIFGQASDVLNWYEEVVLKSKLSDDALLEQGSHCRKQYPRVIFYNRVPKCGSTTMINYLRSNQNDGLNKNYNFTSYDAVNVWNHEDKNPYVIYPSREEREFRTKEFINYPKSVFTTHTTFYPYLQPNTMHNSDGLGIISYFNIIREPFERNQSLWNHIDNCHNIHCDAYRSQFMTSMTTNPMMRYLCGFQPECFLENEDSLYIAKVHAVFSYSFIGIMERMDDSMKILKLTYPTFFSKDYDGAKMNVNKVRGKKYITARTLFEKRNHLDVELYKFIEQVFYRKVKYCGISSQ